VLRKFCFESIHINRVNSIDAHSPFHTADKLSNTSSLDSLHGPNSMSAPAAPTLHRGIVKQVGSVPGVDTVPSAPAAARCGLRGGRRTAPTRHTLCVVASSMWPVEAAEAARPPLLATAAVAEAIGGRRPPVGGAPLGRGCSWRRPAGTLVSAGAGRRRFGGG